MHRFEILEQSIHYLFNFNFKVAFKDQGLTFSEHPFSLIFLKQLNNTAKKTLLLRDHRHIVPFRIQI